MLAQIKIKKKFRSEQRPTHHTEQEEGRADNNRQMNFSYVVFFLNAFYYLRLKIAIFGLFVSMLISIYVQTAKIRNVHSIYIGPNHLLY